MKLSKYRAGVGCFCGRGDFWIFTKRSDEGGLLMVFFLVSEYQGKEDEDWNLPDSFIMRKIKEHALRRTQRTRSYAKPS
jgi:hypothetical protein